MTLHLIPMPYADPDDVSLRALRLLGSVPLIVRADLLPALHALAAHHALTPLRLIDPTDTVTVATALTAGDCAVVTRSHRAPDADAIVQLARQQGVKVEPIPGGDLAIAALVLSALPPDTFVVAGPPPHGVAFAEWATGWVNEAASVVFTLPAERVTEAIAALTAGFGPRQACVLVRPGADGFIARGVLGELTIPDGGWTGEAAIALAGAPQSDPVAWDDSRIRAALIARLDRGEALKVAAKALAAESGWDRRAIYALGVSLRD